MENSVKASVQLMDSFAVHERNWKNEAKEARSKLRSALANSLITSACISYFGPLNHQMRSSLITEWLKCSEKNDFDPEPHVQQPENLHGLTMNSVNSLQTSLGIQCEERTTVTPHEDDALAIHEMERGLSLTSPTNGIHNRHVSSLAKFELGPEVHQHSDLANVSHTSTVLKNLLTVSEKYSFQDIMSSWEEAVEWEIDGLPIDSYSIQNALILRAALWYSKHRWFLLIDPDGQAEIWLNTLLIKCKATGMQRNESDFMSKNHCIYSNRTPFSLTQNPTPFVRLKIYNL